MSKIDQGLQTFGHAIGSWWRNLDGVEKFGYGWILFILLMAIAFIVVFWKPVGMVALTVLSIIAFIVLTLFAAFVVVEHLSSF